MGHDALHTLDLPDANRTTDEGILLVAEREQRVVITKDADFVDSFLLMGRPGKLLLISTGNITNLELEALFLPQLDNIVTNLSDHNFLELSRQSLIVRA